MDSIEKIDLINKSEKYIIDYSNINDGLISNQSSFLDEISFQKYFIDEVIGMPLVLPVGLSSFDYSKASDTFTLNIEEVAKKIFKTSNINYVGVKQYFEFGNEFCIGAVPKKKYYSTLRIIRNINKNLIDLIQKIKKQNKTIAAFQTRNIPHLGHEKIIELLLDNFDYVVINPVIGPKKNGDIKNSILAKVFQFLNSNYYNNRVFFRPLCANMFYAGPREAIHHTMLRDSCGFDGFIVGRDHAGAENIYQPEEAVNLVKKIKNKIKINVITHEGSYYSNRLKKIIIKDKEDDKDSLINISGTDFRKSLINKKIFEFARQELQEYIHNLNEEIFY